MQRVYDLHLKEFLQAWLPGGRFSHRWQDLLKVTDYEVLAALADAAADEKHQLYSLAETLICRKHFRTIYEQMSTHKRKRPEILEELTGFARNAFGDDKVRHDSYSSTSERNDFWVLPDDGSMESSLEVSEVIARLPPVEIGLLFVAPEIKETAQHKINSQLKALLGATDLDYCI